MSEAGKFEAADGQLRSQAWFWTADWQRREREADDDRAAGRVTRYSSDEEFLASLGE